MHSLIEILPWAGNVLVLWGTWMLAKKKRLCLVLYSSGNILWIIYGCIAHVWAIVGLDVILTILNIRAWLTWGKDDTNN